MNKSSVLSFTVIYEEAPEGGYVVRVPALAGCHSQGETIKGAEKNIRESIELYLESLKAHDEEIPKEKKVFQGKIDVQYPLV